MAKGNGSRTPPSPYGVSGNQAVAEIEHKTEGGEEDTSFQDIEVEIDEEGFGYNAISEMDLS